MTNKPLLQEIEDVLQTCDDAMGYMSEYDIPLCLPDDVKKALTSLRKLRESVDVEALDEARERYINYSRYEFYSRDAMLFFKAATKLREILGETQ